MAKTAKKERTFDEKIQEVVTQCAILGNVTEQEVATICMNVGLIKYYSNHKKQIYNILRAFEIKIIKH
jgi:hypothetical protein